MSDKTGGPAFPFGQTDELSGQLVNGWGSEGMTLRDYFAAKALGGLCIGPSTGGRNSRELAEECYQIADAMLKERAK